MKLAAVARIWLFVTLACISLVAAHGFGKRQGSVPAAPQLNSVFGYAAMCDIDWNPSTGATSYTILRHDSTTGTFTAIYTGNTSTFNVGTNGDLYFVDQSCAFSTTYYYEVSASNSSGTSSPSNVGSATTEPQQTSLSAQGGSGSVSLSWTRYTLPQTTGNMKVIRATAQQGPYTQIGMSSAMGYVDSTALNGTTYFYRIQDPSGLISNIATATPWFATVPINIVPNPPLGFLPDPMTFPSWMEQVAATDEPDSPGGETETGSGGPASVLSVNLAHGVVDVGGTSDLAINNPVGPDISFERRYRTAMAAGNLSSRGLSPGWTHNWDCRLVPLSPGTWGGLQLVYPNGASELLSPALDGNGNPLGVFLSPPGAPYVATGVPTSTVGVWSSVKLQHNGNAAEVFTMPSGDTVYRLQSQFFSNNSHLSLYYTAGELTEIDSTGNDGSVRELLALGYGSLGLLSSATDSTTGYSRTYSYSGNQLSTVSEISNTFVNEWTYGYASVGGQPYISSVATQDPQGGTQSASVAYDPNTGRAASLTDAKNDTRVYTYGGTGITNIALSGTIGNPDSYQLGYDPSGKLSGSIDAAGDTTLLSYGSPDPSLVTQVTSPLGNPETVAADAHNNPYLITEPYGNSALITWAYPSYAPLGLVMSVQEFGNGGVSKHPTSYTYYGPADFPEPLNYVKSVTSPNGGITSYTYTAMGNVASIVGPTTSLNYLYTENGPERLGMPSSVTTGGLHLKTSFQFDSNGRLTSTTDPMGNTVSVTYNQYGQPTNLTMPLKALQFSHAVDSKAAVGATLSGFGSLGTSTYDGESGAKSATDANGNTNSLSLDAMFGLSGVNNGNGRLMHQFNPRTAARALDTTIGVGARSISHTSIFDQNGNLLSVSGSDQRTVAVAPQPTDPSMPSSVTAYDPASTSQVQNIYNYDGFGRVILGAIYQGTEDNYTYDDEDNLLSDGTYGTSSWVSYTYNLDGTRSSVTTCGVVYQYGYDADARLTSINVFSGPYLLAYANYTYDNDGRVIAMRTPAMTVFYTYNALGQLTGLQNLTPDGYHWPDGGQGAQVVDGNGITHTIINSFSNIQYDALGDRTHMDFVARKYLQCDGNPNDPRPVVLLPGSATWGYDNGGRLINESWTGNFGDYAAEWQPATSYAYAYDGADNLTTCRGLTQSIDPTSDTLSSTSTNPFLNGPVSYDASTEMSVVGQSFAWWNFYGLQRTSGTLAAGYDAFGQTTQLAAGTTDPVYGPPTVAISTMYYDHLGRRVEEDVNSFDVNSDGSLGQEEFGYEPGQYIFAYDGDDLVSISSNDPNYGSVGSSRMFLWGPTGLALSFYLFDTNGGTEASECVGYAYDPQGSCVDTYEAFGYNGTLSAYPHSTATYNQGPNDNNAYFAPQFYDSYGSLLYNTIFGLDSGQVAYKGQFGYYAEPNAFGPGDIYYCTHRYYDANIGRWLSRDPIGLDGGINTYAYCGGNPVMFADPSGLQRKPEPPGFWESLIPFYGWWKQGRYEAATGHPWRAAGCYLLMGTDVFLVKDAVVIGSRVAAKGGGLLIAKIGVRSAEGLHAVRVAAITSRLGRIVERSQDVELTLNQTIAALRDPTLTAMFRGERIDTAVKAVAGKDWFLNMLRLETTPRGVRGPDFYIRNGDWWDVTTKAQWPAHVRKYGPLGTLLGY